MNISPTEIYVCRHCNAKIRGDSLTTHLWNFHPKVLPKSWQRQIAKDKARAEAAKATGVRFKVKGRGGKIPTVPWSGLSYDAHWRPW